MTFLLLKSIVILVFGGLGYVGNTGISQVLLHRNEGKEDMGTESNLFDITLGVFESASELIGDIGNRIDVKLNSVKCPCSVKPDFLRAFSFLMFFAFVRNAGDFANESEHSHR